jgi:hypothetical protein
MLALLSLVALVTLAGERPVFRTRDSVQTREPSGKTDKQPTGVLRLEIAPTVDTYEPELRERAVMVSLISEGQVVRQTEERLTEPSPDGLERKKFIEWKDIVEGQYDLRVEGDGFATVVKKGFHVFAKETINLFADMREGEGVHIVEYATGGLSREEIAVRLEKIEAALAELTKK